jgi:3-hydroxybutyryl-CoA dehydrogenase
MSKLENIDSIGIIGAGQMGRGIAQVAAMSGYKVQIYDISEDSLRAGNDFIKKMLDKGVVKQKWDESFVTETLKKIQTTTELSDFASSNFVIEAASENKSIKFQIFKNLAEVVRPGTILASNTSSISITEIAACTKEASKVVGMHFMNPVPVMKLVEGIRGLETSEQTFQQTEQLAISLGKTFVKAKDYPGFAVNRILMPMINEAVYALYEGVASVEDIDQAMVLGTNQPMGPLTLADFIGLDTCLAIMEVLFEGLGDSKYRPCPLLKQYVAAKRFGRKSGNGFYKY